jgi:hypothetical protein
MLTIEPKPALHIACVSWFGGPNAIAFAIFMVLLAILWQNAGISNFLAPQ